MKKMITILAVAATGLAAITISPAAVIEPLFMINKAVGGGTYNQYTPGIPGSIGVNNIGLLVKTCGKVLDDPNTTDKYFYIDDGSTVVNEETGLKGIRVSYANMAPGVTFTPPSKGQYIIITGISSVTALPAMPGTAYIPTIRPRYQSDLTVAFY